MPELDHFWESGKTNILESDIETEDVVHFAELDFVSLETSSTGFPVKNKLNKNGQIVLLAKLLHQKALIMKTKLKIIQNKIEIYKLKICNPSFIENLDNSILWNSV